MKKNFLAVMFFIYFLVLTWIIVFKMCTSWDAAAGLGNVRSINLIPLKGSMIVNGKLSISEIMQNVIAFLPFGVYLRALSEDRNIMKEVGAIALTSVIYETLQYILAIGRTDITDVIANTIGGAAGILVCFLIEKLCRKEERSLLVISVCAGIGTIGILGLIVMLLMAN